VKLAILISVTLLAGCAQSSGAMKMGPDTFLVSVHAAPVRGGIPGAQSLAISEANQKCESMGREVKVTNTSARRSGHLPGGTAEVIFQCLEKGDADLARPDYKTPQTVTLIDE
jgi:hypothetical protein